MLLSAIALIALALVPPVDMACWYTRPAADVSEALRVSDGRLAATVFGGVGEDCIQINDVTAGAPLADLLLTFNHSGDFSEYARSFSADHNLAKITYKAGAASYKREVFSTAADDVVVVRLVASHEGALDLEAALSSPHMHSVKCPRANHLILQGDMDLPRQPFELWLVVKAEGGSVESGGGAVSIKGADAATLIVAAGVGDNHAAKCRRAIASAVRKTYPQLLGDHLSVKPD